MAIEIERKFLVINDAWRSQVIKSIAMSQGYLVGSDKASVRVRIAGDTAFMNIKSATLDVTRKEYEFVIPMEDAREILANLCDKPLIEKVRHYVPFGQHTWEVDVFEGDNAGLIVAEIELEHANESFDRPEWLGEEVSDDKRYYNVCLVKHPYKDW